MTMLGAHTFRLMFEVSIGEQVVGENIMLEWGSLHLSLRSHRILSRYASVIQLLFSIVVLRLIHIIQLVFG
jgi:hypothetical protein